MGPRGSVRSAAALVALAFVVLAAPGTSSAANYSVEARDFSFTPVYRVVVVGDTVTWRNSGDAGHTITAYPDAPIRFDSSPRTQRVCANTDLVNPTDCIPPGGSFSVTVTQPGTYNYYCKAHGDPAMKPNPSLPANRQPCGMCGQIVVKAKTPPPSPTRSASASPRPSPKVSASPSPKASASPTASAAASPSSDASPLAAGDGSSGDGGLGRAGVAMIFILLLSGAGYLTWRRFLAPR